mgnify:CR=1 FL=1
MTMGDPNITRQKGRLFCIKQNMFNLSIYLLCLYDNTKGQIVGGGKEKL